MYIGLKEENKEGGLSRSMSYKSFVLGDGEPARCGVGRLSLCCWTSSSYKNRERERERERRI